MESEAETTNAIRVLIADDHAIVRDGLISILEDEPDIKVVGEATHGEEAVNKAKSTEPDIVLLDITMPGMDGLEATRRIREESPEVKILILTMHESDSYFFEILDAGASGYFVKGGSSQDLVSALHAVHRGEMYISPTMISKLLQHRRQNSLAGKEDTAYRHLTSREREILKLVAEGKTSQEIASILFLSIATVQTHRAHIISKLGLRNRAELIKYAIKWGLTKLDS